METDMQKSSYSAPLSRSAMAYVLAGGRGSRLMELTEHRAKPAVPFGGKTRIIDFALSNALNSGVRRIAVATQYKAHSLIRHLHRGWSFLQPMRNESFDILPASQRVARPVVCRHRRRVFQNIDIIDSYGPEYLIVVAGDHIYKMDYERMLVQRRRWRRRHDRLRRSACSRRDRAGRHACRRERPYRVVHRETRGSARDAGPPGWTLASMGIYAFRRAFLHEQLRRDAMDPHSGRDFGRDIFRSSSRTAGPSRTASRDRACVRGRDRDLLARRRHRRRVLRSEHRPDGHRAGTRPVRPGLADLVVRRDHAAGEIRARHRRAPGRGHLVARLRRLHRVGSTVRRSLLFTGVHVHSYGILENAVVLPYVEIGRRARLRNVVIDRGVRIPAELVIGEDPELDSRRFRRTAKGICLVTQAMIDRLYR
jgi:glucose-1-phosphate adenylyltransferase